MTHGVSNPCLKIALFGDSIPSVLLSKAGFFEAGGSPNLRQKKTKKKREYNADTLSHFLFSLFSHLIVQTRLNDGRR